MIRNYLKIALRNLVRQKVYTLINVCGITVSTAACIFIALYVSHELSYDRFNPKADRIYKMVLERKYPNHSTLYSRVPSSMAEVALNDFPEIKNALRFTGPWNEGTFTYKHRETDVRTFYNTFLIQADSSFFSFFPVEFLSGNPKTALSEPKQLVITEAFAKKMFGNEDPLDRVIDGGNFGEYKITGVCKGLPENSHLKFDVVGSISTDPFYVTKGNNFTSFYTHTYFELNEGVDPETLASKFPKMVETYASGEIERELKMSWADYKKAGNGYRYFLQPLTDIHLDPRNFELTFLPSGSLVYVYALILIALIVVMVTCINYVNLATARSLERAREVGIRKVIGSSKGQLVFQFLVESIFLSLMATSVALVLVFILLPEFNSLINQHLNLVLFPGVVWVFGFALLLGLVAGIYPAFVLSSHRPVLVIKGNYSRGEKGSWLRNSLVTFQFVVSTALIACTIIIMQQMTYIRSRNIGFDKSHVVILDQVYGLKNNLQPFVNYVRGLPGVLNTGGVGAYLGGREWESMRLQPKDANEVLTVKWMLMDDDFSNTIGFTFKEGRAFSKEFNDSLSIILNESAVKTLGLKNPIGQMLINANTNDDGKLIVKQYRVVGVVADFNFQPLRDVITPLAIISSDAWGGFYPALAVRLRGSDVANTLSIMETKWKELAPGKLFRSSFLEQSMEMEYADEKRSGKLFAVFSTLAVAIGCVGIFGLCLYSASARTKELSIRKILGASVANLTMLLTRNFIRLVLLAIPVAIPVSWWMMNEWLQGFAYRIALDWAPFAVAAAIALLIPLGVVLRQSLKTALANPISSLRSD